VAAGPGELELGLATAAPGAPLPITSARIDVFLGALERGRTGIRDRRLPPALPDRKNFRMTKGDLQARPACHRKRDSIQARLAIVFAAPAVSRQIEHHADWSIRKFVKTARRYRTIQIQAGNHVITAADPSPTTSARPWMRSTAAADLRTRVAEVGTQ
jgi:hypothetical protein